MKETPTPPALPTAPTLPTKLRECADRVVNHCFNKSGDSALMSIPANRARDADLLLSDAADEIERLEQQLASVRRDAGLSASRELDAANLMWRVYSLTSGVGDTAETAHVLLGEYFEKNGLRLDALRALASAAEAGEKAVGRG